MSDERVVDVVRSSGTYRAVDSALRSMEAGWRTSQARALFGAALGRPRFWSLVVLVASATALALAPLGTDLRPLGWLVPSAVGAVSLFLLVSSSR